MRRGWPESTLLLSLRMTYLEQNRRTYEALARQFRSKIDERSKGTDRLLALLDENLRARASGPCILELGPGSGYAAKRMSEGGFDVTCIEYSPTMARLAAQIAPAARFIVDEFLGHDFGQKKFDAIVAIAFVHLFTATDAQRVMHKIRALMTENGLALVTTTLHDQPSEGWSSKANFSGRHMRYRKRYTREEFELLIHQSGLRVIHSNSNTDGEEMQKLWMNYLLERL